MTQEQIEIAARIRRRAFRSRNVATARKLLRLAEEVRFVRFAAPPRAMLALVRSEDPPMPDLDPPAAPAPCAAFWDGEALVCPRRDCSGCRKARPRYERHRPQFGRERQRGER